jgi:hypothetical protein
MKKQRGSMSVSRTTTGRYLVLVTDSEGDEICEIEMSSEEFASSITGQQSKCDLSVFETE